MVAYGSGRAHALRLPRRLVKTQLWLWFVGMMVLSMPCTRSPAGMPRRMAYYDYSHPDLRRRPDRDRVDDRRSHAGVVRRAPGLDPGARASHRQDRAADVHVQSPAHAGMTTPVALNGFGLWVAMMIALTIVNYGFPIACFDAQGGVGAGRADRYDEDRSARRRGMGHPWFRWSVIFLIVLTLGSIGVGFLWLPSVHRDFTAQGLWASICRAAGVPGAWGQDGAATRQAGPTSTDVVLERTMARAGAEERSAGCHARAQLHHVPRAQGLSVSNARTLPGNTEVVIGQPALTTGAQSARARSRKLAKELTDRQTTISRPTTLPAQVRTAPTTYDETLPALVRVGAPMRNIALHLVPAASTKLGALDRACRTTWWRSSSPFAPAAADDGEADRNMARHDRPRDRRGLCLLCPQGIERGKPLARPPSRRCRPHRPSSFRIASRNACAAGLESLRGRGRSTSKLA